MNCIDRACHVHLYSLTCQAHTNLYLLQNELNSKDIIIEITSCMVGERVRFLFTSKSLQAHSFACDNLRVNKNRSSEPTMMLFLYFIKISFKMLY